MKKTFHILTAALLLTAGALLTTGCGNDDTAIDNGKDQPAQGRTVMFTATLAPMGDNGGQTRAITKGTKDGKEILNVAWKENEEIAIYYLKSDGSTHAKAKAKVTAVDATSGVATIETIDGYHLDDPLYGSDVQFVYPASLMNSNGDDIDANKLLNQHGNLTGANGISTLFDAATGSGTISVAAGKAVVSSKVTMHNRVCICKFHFALDEGTGMGMGGSSEHTFRSFIINDGSHTYTIVSDRPDDMVGGMTRGFKSTDDIYVAMLPIENKAVTFSYRETQSSGQVLYRCTKPNVKLEMGKFYRNLSTITMIKQNPVTLTSSTGELILQDYDIITGTGGENTILKIAAGATVKLNGVTNTGITGTTSIPGIECLGDATIILSGENSVRGREYAPGIFIPSGHTLTIMGSGKLDVTGGNTSQTGAGSALIGGAGIGGTDNTSCGNIVIAGGTITATGTGNCVGIGSGCSNGANITCGDITISGGTVTATGGDEAAGIGSGRAGNNTNKCGAITISGGSVTATGGDWAAGIGSGNADNTNTCGAITISGGTVEATGGEWAAGIGSGHARNNTNTCGDITISGSAQVKAVGKKYAAGIGTGRGNGADKNGICGAISITGGTVEATGGDRGAGIGSGECGKFSSISIGSGITSVTATRSNNFLNVPIGKGNDDQGSGAVTIDGQTLSDAQTKGTADLPVFPNLQVVKSDGGGITNKTWTITHK